jgi:hypothetical protein
MKSHTSGLISMGTGAILCKSSKQKLNTKSSTEAELVGASDYLPNTLWSKRFLEAQGHAITNNIFNQDNVSAIRLEKNGKASAGRQSRHIDIRYFFIKDRIKQDGINIQHCPTHSMLADFLTKPLQGALFRILRDVLLGYKHVNALLINPSDAIVPEERVGINEYEDSEDDVSSKEDTENEHSQEPIGYECLEMKNDIMKNEIKYANGMGMSSRIIKAGETPMGVKRTLVYDEDTGSTAEPWSLVVKRKKDSTTNTADRCTKNNKGAFVKLPKLTTLQTIRRVN